MCARQQVSALLLVVWLVFHFDGFSQTSPGQEAPKGIYHVGKGITAPRVISKVAPVRPPGKAMQGVVVLGLIVDRDGNPRNIHVQGSLRPDYDDRAMAAVSQWKFSPASKDGLPVAVVIGVEIKFGPEPTDPKGHFNTPSVYENPALGMTLALPGEWQFFEKDEQRAFGLHPTEPGSNPNCRGPLCQQDVNVALVSKRGTPPVGTIFIAGYRIPPEYRDRQRYPLAKFAEAMMKDSLGSSGWVPLGDMTAITLGSQPAYRLLVHKMSQGYDMKGFGYVVESNGHTFLMVASAASSADAPRLLQSAVENLSLSSSKQ